MSSVLGLEADGSWRAESADRLREFLEAAREDAVVLDLPEGIVLIVDVEARQGHPSVVALGRLGDGLAPLDGDQEAWIRGWTETVRSSRLQERLEAVALVG